MKILHIGNLNRMGEEFAKVFRSLGHTADVLLWAQSCMPVADKSIAYKNIYGNWEERYPHPVNEFPKETALLRAMWEAADNYDLFICHFAFQSAIFAYLIKKMKGTKYIVHVRGGDVRINLNHPIYRKLVAQAIRNAEMVWCSTPDLVGYTKKLNENSFWVSNVVKTDIFKPPKRKIDLREGHELSIFSPSRQNWKVKRNDESIRALERILKEKDAILHMVDHGADAPKSKALIKKLGLENNVKWHEKIIDQKKLARMYNSADVVWDDFSNLR